MCPSRSQCPATDTPHKGKKGRKFPARRPHPSSRGPAEEQSGHWQEAAETPHLPASNDSPPNLTRGQWGPTVPIPGRCVALSTCAFPPRTRRHARCCARETRRRAGRCPMRQREHSRPMDHRENPRRAIPRRARGTVFRAHGRPGGIAEPVSWPTRKRWPNVRHLRVLPRQRGPDESLMRAASAHRGGTNANRRAGAEFSKEKRRGMGSSRLLRLQTRICVASNGKETVRATPRTVDEVGVLERCARGAGEALRVARAKLTL